MEGDLQGVQRIDDWLLKCSRRLVFLFLVLSEAVREEGVKRGIASCRI